MENYMYLGPDIPGVVLRNQIFTYKPDAIIEEARGKCELAKYLFVPMTNIVKAKNDLREQGSIINAAFIKTLESI